MGTKSNRNDNVTLEVMDGKQTTVAYLPKGCRKVRVEVFPYHVDRIVNSRARKPIIPLDAEILAEVYLEMNGGRQQNINLTESVNKTKKNINTQIFDYSKKIYEVTDQEKKKHQELLDFINNF